MARYYNLDGGYVVKWFVITAFTYRAISSGWMYDLSFRVDGIKCERQAVRAEFSTINCEGIKGFGLLTKGTDGHYLQWHPCHTCERSDIVKLP